VYEVDEKRLASLDRLENHPTFYVRRLEPVRMHADGAGTHQLGLQYKNTYAETKHCWTYFLPRFRDELLKLPMLTTYASNGDHGRRYVER
jgi:gamma-glutamylaminecyclotransferase